MLTLLLALRIPVEGLDDCCAPKALAALQTIPGVSAVAADLAAGSVCLQSTEAWSTLGPQVTAALAPLQMRPGAPDPAGLCAAAVDPWAGVTGDFAIASQGERVSLAKAAAPGKITIIDFGAIWCGPCHEMAAGLKAALAARPNLAVRAVLLPGVGAKDSFASPVALQHLAEAPGLPYVIVLNAKGKRVWAGSSLDEALAAATKAGAP